MVELKNGMMLRVESDQRRLRLVILDGKKEYVCRKESHKNLMNFAAGIEKEIFKGRLKLRKSKRGISIIAKDEEIGQIGINQFKKECELANG